MENSRKTQALTTPTNGTKPSLGYVEKSETAQVSVEEILQVGKFAKKKPTLVSLTPVDKKDAHIEPVGLVETSGKYSHVLKIRKPVIRHDGGFVERYGTREPTANDYLLRLKWIHYMAGAESLCHKNVGKWNPLCRNEDQSDAVAAYRHFWEGHGKNRFSVNYEKYLSTEPTAVNIISDLLDEFILHVEVIGVNRTSFLVSSSPYRIGKGGFAAYPMSVNWQRTIGAHYIWVAASVAASAKNGKIQYVAEIMIHMEDRYNFNPDQKDESSGIADAENGVFEMVGWAHGYMNYAAVARRLTWTVGELQSRRLELRPVPPPQLHLFQP